MLDINRIFPPARIRRALRKVTVLALGICGVTTMFGSPVLSDVLARYHAGFGWQGDDASTEYWVPQGLTGADDSADEAAGGPADCWSST